jgi:hypothetical protein
LKLLAKFLTASNEIIELFQIKKNYKYLIIKQYKFMWHRINSNKLYIYVQILFLNDFTGLIIKTNIKISLDTRRVKKDGSFPLILRLTHGRNTIPISLGYSIPIQDWNE